MTALVVVVVVGAAALELVDGADESVAEDSGRFVSGNVTAPMIRPRLDSASPNRGMTRC